MTLGYAIPVIIKICRSVLGVKIRWSSEWQNWHIFLSSTPSKAIFHFKTRSNCNTNSRKQNFSSGDHDAGGIGKKSRLNRAVNCTPS